MTDQMTDFSSGKKMADKLTHMKELVVKFSDQFTNAPFYEIKQKIDEALKEIVECLGVDRGVFWEMSENFTDMLVSHYYALPEVADVEMINYRDFPWVMEKMLYREHVCLHSLEDLPADAATDRESFLKLGIKSFVAIPHFIGGYPVAGLMFDSRREEIKCHEDFVTQLKLIGEIVTGAFYRMKMEERYRKNFIGIRLANGRIREEEFPLTELTKSEFQYEGIIGDSEAMRLVFSKMEQVAPTDSTVLILGETGTGKGVLARAIYELSNRNKKRIVTVNCAALTPNLIESELFGREKGAYTGSTEMQIGRFELADGGTLVLDEFTELPLDLQAKLLRAIQDGEFERLGSPRTLRVNVRIIALTSRNLKEEVSQGRFRQDLYYRLNVFPITMPPLRERISDIPLLVEHFVEQFNRRMQKDINNIPKTVMAELMKYSWPGNVRELEHVIERSMIVTRGSSLQLAEKLDESGSGMVEEDLVTDLAEIEKIHILKILDRTGWRIEGPKGAAVLLGLHPNTLRGRMQKLGIRMKKVSS